MDAQRNLRHVLSAARDVFGEQGYGAPMEEVARRARVGVGTVYRRFPNKEALVRYIAEEETQRLASQAREALARDGEPWGALEGFVQQSAAAGTGRLLPPELIAASMRMPVGGEVPADGGGGWDGRDGRDSRDGRVGSLAAEGVPGQRTAPERLPGQRAPGERQVGERPVGERQSGERQRRRSGVHGALSAASDGAAASAAPPGPAAERWERRGEPRREEEAFPSETRELLTAVAQLVERTRASGQLRADVTVADLMLVIASSPPRVPEPARQATASARLLEILLQGLRAHGAR